MFKEDSIKKNSEENDYHTDEHSDEENFLVSNYD